MSTKWGGARHTLFGKMEPVEMNEPSELMAERDRQYEENVNQIVKYAALEAKYAELVAALMDLVECRIFSEQYRKARDRAIAALDAAPKAAGEK